MSKQTDLINIPDAITVSGSNVGIGTNNPNSYSGQTTLTINGQSYGRLDVESAGTLRASLFATAGSTTLSATTDTLSFDTSGGEAMRIDASGNVGIGTSSPTTRLSFGNYISSNGQTIHTYQDGNVVSGLGIVAGVHRMFTNDGANLSYGHVSVSDGSTYTERMKIDASGRVTTPNVPAFLAFKSNGSVTSSQIVQWNNIYHNNGGHYSAATGKFTAPVDGYYHFTVGAIVGGSPVDGTERNGELQLQKNGSHYTRGHWNMKDRWENVSYTQVMYLSANDEARVSFVNSTGDNQMYGSDLYSHFGGHLIG